MGNLNAYRDSTIDLGNRGLQQNEENFQRQQEQADEASNLSKWGLGLSSADLLTKIPWKSAIGGLRGLGSGVTGAGNIGSGIGGYGAAAGAGSAMTGIGSTFASGAGSSALAAEIGGMSGGMTTAGGVGAGSLGGGTAGGSAAGAGAGMGAIGAMGVAIAPLAIAYGLIEAYKQRHESPIPGYGLALDQGIIPDIMSEQAIQYRAYLQELFRVPDSGYLQGYDELSANYGTMIAPDGRALVDSFMADPINYMQQHGTNLMNPFLHGNTIGEITNKYRNIQPGQSFVYEYPYDIGGP